MKVRFNRQELADALSAIREVAATRTPKDILKCVRLEAATDAVLLCATDLEVSLRYVVSQVEVERLGSTVVMADTLNRIVRECADEILELDVVDHTLHIRGAGSHFQVLTRSAEDFPPVAEMKGAPDITIDNAQLRRLVEWTVFACAKESSRYAINGVLWAVEGKCLTLVATDGRRLSLARGNLAKTGSDDGRLPLQVIVPSRALALFGRLVTNPENEVAVKLATNQMMLGVGGVTLSTALVEGHFPNYDQVIPKDSTYEVTLDTAEFQSALRRAALLTDEVSRGVRFSFADGTLTLSSRAPEQGEATITLPVRYSGEPMEIGFNPMFVQDVLRVAHEDELVFAFKEPSRPGVVRMGGDFIYVVMPVNLTSA